ncbi:FMN-binding glutamate synthase family protein [Pseudosulfitobacter pseudonitzschiae]|uniref:FMN-binding glutamate synthase family protein n=1 Tax=Pseudosulfitobacter pseudonitzschiae TaxID=1402135 RepID=UPI001AF94096|nr:FMN-binding glutamate synthase family protein [Pseudosulfitobacter pseudonitzschiae]MBM1815954.1 FMN-binding glutamate synthase family protein [Pseudosulfitobacter pseudonitzschiae]MBM1832945.1 FMN-binding glutamate synthase family protein [Pseudosulfitobacter pseudonitzschiae]MBM1837813.1 FMN-binding glutamate synthase family protein [Pseudosulfitobacter pseudonitzschiae]MBM1842659.1 FMN-binding glutamate synthase family protein [Pseudosulfitobacter pseudonitzschiae]MBM1847527.1 FMN-bindin
MSSPLTVLEILAFVFIGVIGIGLLCAVVLFAIDRLQTQDAIRRNYPVIGRFRHIFSTLGEFFRQYFFAMDREELPFNRAQRDWIKRTGEPHSNTVAFGSTRNLSIVGTPIFVNAAFPPLDNQFASSQPMVIGAGARMPYTAHSFFNISGMSYGALSRPAVRALSRGAAKAGIWMNTGEGGLSPFHLEGGCDIVFQIGTAKFGVRNEDGSLNEDKLRKIAANACVKMFELKLAQGAKPGKGGILPGAKVTAEIAEIRGLREGVDAISPNRHVEIDDWDDLLDMIVRLRDITGKPVGIKTVVGDRESFRDLMQTIKKRGDDCAPDFFTIDGGEGGTGAAPMPLIDLVGMSIRESLPLAADLRNEAGLKDRIRLVASGKLVNPGDVAWALAAGADFITSARGFMFSLGCIQSLKCNKNTCPTGITTHNPRLQKGLVVEDKDQRVALYAKEVIHEVEIIAHSVGVAEPRLLRRRHVRIVQDSGRSAPMNEIYPSLRADG